MRKLDKRVRFCIGTDFGFHLRRDWYDGPFWDLQILWFGMVWSLYGLPYIFQPKSIERQQNDQRRSQN